MRFWLLVFPILVACTGTPDTYGDDDDDSCAEMFHQTLLPEWHVTISPDEWNAMQDEFLSFAPNPAYHPIELTYNDQPVPGAEIRLKGSSSWQQTIQLDDNPKMQFRISFDEQDPSARFQGLRKVDLDMPRIDQTFLHQRVALYWMRQEGLPAPCANNAKLYINGEYYGLYTNLEHQDKEFLQRVFPDASDGDLWKSGLSLETNETTATMDRLNQFWGAQSVDELRQTTDLDGSLKEWTAEAMIGDADGYNQGRPNFLVYDHPTQGFVWLANDLDTSIDWDFLPPDVTPVFTPVPAYEARWESDWVHYMMVMQDPAWVQTYVRDLADARARYDVGALQAATTAWANQTAAAADEDPHKPFTTGEHALAVQRMLAYFPAHAAYIDQWLACWSGGGADADGDGSDLCHDCNDADDAVHPGAAEVCDMLDDDCDGRVDDVDGVTVCE